MPESYYVSQYSGEEIDALLGGAGTGTVRYDAAQTLTDAQKQQARGNIAAAPDGYGLGTTAVLLTESDDLDNVMGNGWYYWGSSIPANAPALINAESSAGYCSMLIINGSQIVVSSNDRNNSAMRTRNYTGWIPWEYINPPLKLGVEYRTTERYLGKPVYVKVVDCGKFPAPGTSKLVAHGISNCTPVTVTAQMSNSNTVPYVGYYTIGVDNTAITLASVSGVSDLSAHNTVATMRYIKTTD